jgi:hypothetical protein
MFEGSYSNITSSKKLEVEQLSVPVSTTSSSTVLVAREVVRRVKMDLFSIILALIGR